MAELKVLSPLKGYNREFSGGTRLYEPEAQLLMSLSIPLGGGPDLEGKLKAALGVSIPKSESKEGPEIGRWNANKEGSVRCLGLGLDQVMIVCSAEGDAKIASLKSSIGDAGYITDQSDNWASLMIDGPSAQAALERLCMLDLDPSACPDNFCSRTVMEHLPVVIVREAHDRFLLMTLTSYADSFLHAFETALESVT